MNENGVNPDLLATRTAALQRSLVLLAKLEAMVSASGGHMDHDDQELLRESREFLAAMGMRIDPNPPKTWIDRVATRPKNGHSK